METREEKLATWADPSVDEIQSFRLLKGSLQLDSSDLNKRARVSEQHINVDQVEHHLIEPKVDKIVGQTNTSNIWHFKAISVPRLRPGRLVVSIPKPVFQQIQNSWSLHPRTMEIFLSNNGVFSTFSTSDSGQTSVILKVANSRTTGFDCVSVTCDPARRTTYALYHHLEDEASVFATLISNPERCMDPHFYVGAVYRAHHQHIELYRNVIDDAIQGIERQTGFGNPGRLHSSQRPARRASMDEYPVLEDPKSTIQQLSYCQTDLAIIGHVARCCLECGDWLVGALDDKLPDMHDTQYVQSIKTVRPMVRQDVEYMRRRTVMLLSQVQQMKDRVQSQTVFMLNTITQSDAEYTAAIAVDGRRDSSAMKTIAILGIVFLPGTFMATLFSSDMFDWGADDSDVVDAHSLTVSRKMWIYWVITVPLTVLTLLLWMLWTRRETSRSSQRLMIYRTTKVPVKAEGVVTNVVSKVYGDKMV
ncbi:hypothetical protein N0V95_005254 [Ascochyta clinopodiicola]|nr:hypothetical protein N0V95_005254 [Ascochyta clinopodiicola]